MLAMACVHHATLGTCWPWADYGQILLEVFGATCPEMETLHAQMCCEVASRRLCCIAASMLCLWLKASGDGSQNELVQLEVKVPILKGHLTLNFRPF